MQVLVPVPWSKRLWGLPFFSVMVPSQATPRRGQRPYRTSVDWAICMVRVVSRWLKRLWVCVGDGSYGSAKFGWACRRCGVILVARLPWKAHLYDFAPTMPERYRGHRRTKGARQPSMPQHVDTLSAKYAKTDITFSDLLLAVRTALWQARFVLRPASSTDLVSSLEAERQQLIRLLASAF